MHIFFGIQYTYRNFYIKIAGATKMSPDYYIEEHNTVCCHLNWNDKDALHKDLLIRGEVLQLSRVSFSLYFASRIWKNMGNMTYSWVSIYMYCYYDWLSPEPKKIMTLFNLLYLVKLCLSNGKWRMKIIVSIQQYLKYRLRNGKIISSLRITIKWAKFQLASICLKKAHLIELVQVVYSWDCLQAV